jgi:hypothetical protein
VRTDVAFACQQLGVSERRACKLIELDRSSYRYEPRSDHNIALRQELVNLARQKPRYGYRRLDALVTKRGFEASAQRVYRLYRTEGLMVRRLKRRYALEFPPVCEHLVDGRGHRTIPLSYQDFELSSKRWRSIQTRAERDA